MSRCAPVFLSKGRGTGFAGPQAPSCDTQPFCMPSKPALQVWSRGTQPPRGAGSYAKRPTVGAISSCISLQPQRHHRRYVSPHSLTEFAFSPRHRALKRL